VPQLQINLNRKSADQGFFADSAEDVLATIVSRCQVIL